MRRRAIFLFVVFSLMAILLFRPSNTFAQSNRATITGTVTDSSGAVVVGVEVTATNVETGIPTNTVSNSDGIYVVPNLFPGNYSLLFRKNGFETIERPIVRLESTQVARIDTALKVGSTVSSITVTSDAPVLDLERPTVGTNMNGAVVTDLPLSIYDGGRFVENFAVAITPGYSVISSPYGAVVNGGQWFTKDYTVDGTSGSSSIQGDSLETGPSMEAVQELQAQTSGLDAESSITGGGVMSFNLKSGTNRFHGSLFGYGHNELLDANTWTNDSQGEGKAKKRAWDYGASLGGPIFKNKTFFFGTFERYTQTDARLGGLSSGTNVPTTDFLAGNFSALLNTSQVLGTDTHGNPIYAGAIFNPNDAGAVFVGNIIPSTMISARSQQIVNIYQKSYAPVGSNIDSNNRLPLSNSPFQTPNQAVVKLDHVLTDKDHLSGSWIYNHRPRTLVDSGGVWAAGSTDGGPLSAARLQFVPSDEYRVSESHTFSPNVLNVLNLTYNWYWNRNGPAAAANWDSQLNLPDTGAVNFPLISFGNAVNGHTETFIGNNFQGDFTGAAVIVGDNVTWTKGRHNVTFGGDFHAQQINSHSGSGALSFNFSNNPTGAPSQSYGNQVGFGFASFLLGDVDTASQTTPFNLYGRQKTMSLYGQDSYKVRSNLTLTYGLRWDYNFRFHEKYGHWANYDLNAIDPTLGIPGTLVYAKNGSDSFEKNEYATNFAPTIGFAYSPWAKAVFRGSFGIIYNPPGVPYFNGVPDGFAPGFKGTNQASNPFNWDAVQVGYPGVFKPGNKGGDPSTVFPLVNVDPRALRVGYSDAFNLGAQYELTSSMRVEVSYVGNRGHRLTDTALANNQGPTSTFLRLAQQNPGLNSFSNPVCSSADAATYGIKYPYNGFCGTLLAAIAPYPQVGAAFFNPFTFAGWYFPSLLYAGLPLGQSYYDSMIVDVVKRTGRGLTMDMSYTLSRTEGDTFSAQQENNGFYTPIQDFNNMGVAAHALTNYDQTHVIKGFVSYELPFGTGQRWLADQGKLVNRVVGGWHLTGLVAYYTGQPFQVGVANQYYPLWGNIYPNFNLSGFKGPNSPGNFVIPPAATPSNPNPTIPPQDFYIPQSVATAPAPGQFGQAPDTSALRCPGQANENASLLKDVPMGSDGQYRLSFRAEFYNLFNRHYYNINGCGGNRTTVGATNFGQITGVADNPRNGQFAIRFEF
jgi:Carboxypeptidase regulatory-like domain